jgi:hypothetical protein
MLKEARERGQGVMQKQVEVQKAGVFSAQMSASIASFTNNYRQTGEL